MRRAESGILASVYKTAAGLHKAGLIDKATMREFESLCLGSVRIVDVAEADIDQVASTRMDADCDYRNRLLDKE